MRPHLRLRATLWATALGLLLVGSAAAQSRPDSGVEFPAEAGAWINSGPISTEALKGKAALLWFFEEQCPRCRGKWPEMMELSKRYADKPVVFIAINSGNPRPTIEQYARECKITWPILIDPTREFERAAGMNNEISLQNIYQAKVLTSTGQLANGNWSDLPGTVERALQGASWRVDPASIPAPLKQTWLSIEFGNFPAAAALVKKGMAAANPEIKAASEKLNAAVQSQAATEIAAARQLAEAGSKWPAYKAFESMKERFAGYDLPAEVESQQQALAAADEIKKQSAAVKALDTIKRTARTNTPTGRRAALTRLKKLTEDFPGTEAAQEAQTIIDQNSAS